MKHDEEENDDSVEATDILQDLIERARTLMSELEIFREHLRAIRHEQIIELAHFRGTVQSELNMLERLSRKPAGESTNHVARSSNLPFLESVWNAAKQYPKLAALHKKLYFNSPSKSLSQAMHHVDLGRTATIKERKNASVTVDAITDGGLTWIKLSLVTNTRLLFDLAKQGWQSDESDEGFSSGPEDVGDKDPDDDVPLVKVARELCIAAKSFRIRTKHPTVRLLLPRIQPGEMAEVDKILEDCKATGAILICGQDITRQNLDGNLLQFMAPDPLQSFTETINLDCTILLALVSEFSHARVSKEPWFHTALKRQVEIEGNENLLPSLLYPAMKDHKLVCTQEAATRMHEIVTTIGTPSEKARTSIMMGLHPAKSRQELIDEMQKWSAHAVPKEWQLPVAVVSATEGDCQANLPSQALQIGEAMTAINRSVFLYGWASGKTTITSNRTVVKHIETELDKHIDLDASTWPKLWLCPTARSLVGKEKRGSKKDGKKEGVWPLPDPLRREQQRRNGLDVLSLREGHEVEDLRPNGYPCEEVLEAKNASRRQVEEGLG